MARSSKAVTGRKKAAGKKTSKPAVRKRVAAPRAKPARARRVASAPAPMRQEFTVPGLNAPISHYCDAVRFGDLLFISGMAPLDADGKLIAWGDAEGQTEAVFQSLDKVLKAAGATFADVLKVTVFLTNVDDRAKINPVRQRYFGTARPASTLIEVSRLAISGMRVEIEAVVGLPGKKKRK